MDNLLIITLVSLSLLVVVRVVLARRQKQRDIDSDTADYSQRVSPQAAAPTAAVPESPAKPAATASDAKATQSRSKPGLNLFAEAKSHPGNTRPAEPTSGNSADLSEPEEPLSPRERMLRDITSFGAPVPRRLEAIREAGRQKVKEAIPRLIEVLYDPEPTLASAAAESLGEIGDPQAIEPLMEISRRTDERLLEETGLKSREEQLPRESGSDAPIENPSHLPVLNPFNYKEMTLFRVDLLPAEYKQADGTPIARKELVIKGLKDNDQQLRKMAAKAAIGMDDPELTTALVETLANPYEVESVRYLAAEALGGIQDERAIEPLLKAMDDEKPAVRYSAAAALAKFGDQKVVDRLIGGLRDGNEFVRSSVAYALGSIGNSEALNALMNALEDESEVVRFSIAKALGAIGGREVLEGLKRRLSASDKKMKSAVIEVLGQIKEEEACGILRKALRDADSDISFRASLALMNQESLDVLEDLIQASQRLDQELMAWVKGEGPAPAGDMPTPDFSSIKPSSQPSADVLPSDSQTNSPAPGSEEADGANDAFQEIERHDSASEEVGLEKLRVALQHASPNVRGCAANALGDYSSPVARELLFDALTDPHEYVRSIAISSLSKKPQPDDLGVLLQFVGDSSEEVRYAVARALSSFSQTEKAKTALLKMAEKDSSRDVKRAARMALEGKRA